jgi:hypothetical protein
MFASYLHQFAVWRKARWQKLLFGDITERVVGTAGDGVPAEIEYRGRGGRVIGYFAYGSYDPALPYRG